MADHLLRSRRVAIAVTVAALLAPAAILVLLATTPGPVLDGWVAFNRTVRPLPPPTADQPWRQAVRASQACLSRADVLLTPDLSRNARGAVSLALYEGDALVATTIVEEAGIGEGQFSRLEFAPRCDSAGRSYSIVVAPLAGRLPIGVWSNPEAGPNSGPLSGPEAASGSLVTRTYVTAPADLLARLPWDKPPWMGSWFFTLLLTAYMVLLSATVLFLLWPDTGPNPAQGPPPHAR